MVNVEIYKTENEARLAGFIPIEEAIKIRPGDHSNYVKQAKNPKHPLKGCQVFKGARLVWYVSLDSLNEEKKEETSYKQLKSEFMHQMLSGAFSQRPCSQKYIDDVLEYGLKKFFLILQVEASIEGLTAENFNKVLNSEELKVDEIRRRDSYSIKTNIYRACTRFLDYLIHLGLKKDVDRIAFKKYLPKAKYDPKRRMVEEDEIEEAIHFNSTWREGRTDYDIDALNLLIHLYAFAGLRRMEAAQLRVSDIDFKNNVMIVFGKGSKERHVPLNLFPQLKPVMEKWVLRYCHCEENLLIAQSDGQPLTESSIQQRFQRLRLAMNYKKAYQKLQQEYGYRLAAEQLKARAKTLAESMKKGPRAHDLRRTCATMLAKQGMPISMIQLILGHKDPKTTEKYILTDIRQVLHWLALRQPSSMPTIQTNSAVHSESGIEEPRINVNELALQILRQSQAVK
jgi:integrase